MLYSHNQENEKLKLFTIFLTHAVEGNINYASAVNDVIHETHQYTVGEKSLYDINRDAINIILLLTDLDKSYFQQLSISPHDYNKQTYSKVLDIIASSKEATYY
ncbi:hypothetical protein [Niabella drilacis]|uniref:Uncharacterized protein n=1 Tax=Niabella drilacis (strain DSM 25811 / CCM 8410 / CCUG 62505 / LMG 26954 / E90) TaxID=1285928 RepID=A0A1G6XJY6_NIADE|nr:hypothetical protein [Niabella drilacis]SDD77637.1 hypothetical protein SAMN04487894_11379 [Niabella drilacis]